MPVGYDIECRDCGRVSAVTWSYLSLRHDGRDIPLTHPNESGDLKRHGYTYDEAASAGRLHDNYAYTCTACNTLFYKPALKLPENKPPSRKANIIFGIIAFPTIGYLVFNEYSRWWTLGIGLPFAAIYATVISSLEGRRTRIRVATEHKLPELDQCPGCGSDQIAPLRGLNLSDGDTWPCRCISCGGHDVVLVRSWLS